MIKVDECSKEGTKKRVTQFKWFETEVTLEKKNSLKERQIM